MRSPRDTQIPVARVNPVDMKIHAVVGAEIEPGRALCVGVVRSILTVDRTRRARRVALGRDAVVNDIDDSADRGATIEDRSRTAYHLDPVHCDRSDRYVVVEAQGRSIER